MVTSTSTRFVQNPQTLIFISLLVIQRWLEWFLGTGDESSKFILIYCPRTSTTVPNWLQEPLCNWWTVLWRGRWGMAWLWSGEAVKSVIAVLTYTLMLHAECLLAFCEPDCFSAGCKTVNWINCTTSSVLSMISREKTQVIYGFSVADHRGTTVCAALPTASVCSTTWP